jgi:hypothetical protein
LPFHWQISALIIVLFPCHDLSLQPDLKSLGY